MCRGMTLSPQPTDNYIYDGNAEADLAEFLRFTSDHDMSSEAWGVYVEDGVSATTSKPFPVLEPRTVKIPPLIVGKDSYGSNGKKFRYGPPPRYLPPMEPGLLSGARQLHGAGLDRDATGAALAGCSRAGAQPVSRWRRPRTASGKLRDPAHDRGRRCRGRADADRDLESRQPR